MEFWRVIEEAPSYQVSRTGYVRNIATGRILKGGVGDNGYVVVTLREGNRNLTRLVHLLVAYAFNVKPDRASQVNHDDGNKLNNRHENLIWCTPGENVRHAYSTGLRKTKRVVIVETGRSFDSASDCARWLEVDRSMVSNTLAGRTRTCRGFRLAYENV